MGITIVTQVVIFLLFLNVIVSKKSLPDLDLLNTGQLNECKRCKILTDSFDHWIYKTSRGKFEGGDAAWEESKLKSYSRSEVRLVEIQEGLCSEVKRHQDDCYTLAEEVEQVLEKWWFIEAPDSANLYTWLCIQTLQHCCPKDHFGELCIPCLHDINNNVCSGNGKCNGEGTRKGNGTCTCFKGYDGNICDECAKDFFKTHFNSCEPCHKACNGCSGEGAKACRSCNPGWQLEFDECKDINECLNHSICKTNQYCINKEGSHSCKACHESCDTCTGSRYTDCISCKPTYILLGGRCLNEEYTYDVIKSTTKRLAMYLGLFIIVYFILRQYSKSYLSLLVLIFAVCIYFLERSYEISSWEVLLNLSLFLFTNYH